MMDEEDGGTRVALFTVMGLIALVLSLVVGLTIYTSNKKKAAANASAAVSAGALAGGASGGVSGGVSAGASSNAAAATSALRPSFGDGPGVVVEVGVVKFYFASGKGELAQGAKDALVDVVRGTSAGKKAVVSGFTDASGDPVKNAELAKTRAFAVRDALSAMGIKAEQIELRKPGAVAANAVGSSADARRVDVTLE